MATNSHDARQRSPAKLPFLPPSLLSQLLHYVPHNLYTCQAPLLNLKAFSASEAPFASLPKAPYKHWHLLDAYHIHHVAEYRGHPSWMSAIDAIGCSRLGFLSRVSAHSSHSSVDCSSFARPAPFYTTTTNPSPNKCTCSTLISPSNCTSAYMISSRTHPHPQVCQTTQDQSFRSLTSPMANLHK